MKNINDVLKQKEIEYLQLQKEIEALRTAARLLADDSDPYKPSVSAPPAPARVVTTASEPAFASSWDASAKKFP
jgi:uncharacterized protein involved in exopolysaccharide biosynthesis